MGHLPCSAKKRSAAAELILDLLTDHSIKDFPVSKIQYYTSIIFLVKGADSIDIGEEKISLGWKEHKDGQEGTRNTQLEIRRLKGIKQNYIEVSVSSVMGAFKDYPDFGHTKTTLRRVDGVHSVDKRSTSEADLHGIEFTTIQNMVFSLMAVIGTP